MKACGGGNGGAPDSTGAGDSIIICRQHATARRARAFCGTMRRGEGGAAAGAAAALGRRFIQPCA